MCEVLTHRGPDDEGYYVHQNVGLGMRRLKVIDLETGQRTILVTPRGDERLYVGKVHLTLTFAQAVERLSAGTAFSLRPTP